MGVLGDRSGDVAGKKGLLDANDGETPTLEFCRSMGRYSECVQGQATYTQKRKSVKDAGSFHHYKTSSCTNHLPLTGCVSKRTISCSVQSCGRQMGSQNMESAHTETQ